MPSSAHSDLDKHKSEHVRSFGRRRGKKLRPGREHLVDELLPKIKFDITRAPSEQFTNTFPDKINDIWLEIGFGGGEHLAAQALAHPEVGFIGAEPFINGVAKLVTTINAENISNIRIWPDDVRMIFPEIPDNTLGKIFILFPDPWPKKRHAKRRLLSNETLDEIHRIMKPGAELVVASDHVDYVRFALFQISSHSGFEWLAQSAQDWRNQPQGWTQTRYEEKALAKGIKATYLVFSRLSLNAGAKPKLKLTN